MLWSTVLVAAITTVVLATSERSPAAAAALTVSVTPSVAMAPAAALIIAMVEPHEDNRRLTIAADSPVYYRSSQRELEGEDAARKHSLLLKGLPASEYTIEVSVSGTRGRRIKVQRTLAVVGGDR